MTIETRVVVLENETYVSGNGYAGPVLTELGFPEGPYLPGIARIFVNQAKSVNSKIKFKIVEYVPEFTLN